MSETVKPQSSGSKRLNWPHLLNGLRIFSAPTWTMLLAVVFASTALLGGFIQDDNYFILRYSFADQFPGLTKAPLSPFGMFSLGDGSTEQAKILVEQGLAPWWIDPHFKFNLLRPLAEWSHAVDFYFWPHNPLLMHIHSLAWFLAVVYAATRFFRLILGPTPLCGLTVLLFCLDSNFGWVNGWLASRNTLMCLALGIFSINHFIEACRGQRFKFLFSLLLFSCALLSGEFSLSSLAWIFSFLLFTPSVKGIDSDSSAATQCAESLIYKFKVISPFLVVTAIWAYFYIKGGHGVMGSGDYTAPFKEPLRFTLHLLSQAPDTWFQEIYFIAYTLFGPASAFSMSWFVGLIGIGVFIYFYLMSAPQHKWFWIAGVLMTALPACAGSGGSRVAMYMLLGIAPMLANVIYTGLTTATNKSGKGYAWILVGLKTLMLPLTLLAPIILNRFDLDNVITPAKQLAISEADSHRTLVMINPYYEPASRLFKIVRLQNKLPLPNKQLSLANGMAAIEISRPSANSLILTPQDGFASNSGERFMRNIESNPSRINEELAFSFFRATILSITTDGRPKSVKFEFNNTLESENFIWLQCAGSELTVWQPIQINSSATLPACTTAN